jgi:hypothetical protein
LVSAIISAFCSEYVSNSHADWDMCSYVNFDCCEKGISMKRFAPIAFVAAVAAPVLATTARAWVLEDVVAPENMRGVEVVVQDEAVGGCWTNIGEAKTYAQDKLRELGYSIYVEDDRSEVGKQMDFDILVHSGRGSDGTCYGGIWIRLLAPAELTYSEGSAFAILGEVGYTFVKRENANVLVLELIKVMIDEMTPEA